MRLSAIIICLGILSGCSSVQQITNNHAPVLLVQYPFPAIPASICNSDYLLVADMLILKDGSVSDVKLMNTGVSKEWDAIAVSTIKTWKYSPLKMDDKPTSCWVHQKMKIRIAEPLIFSLAAVLCSTSEQADSVYIYLINGRNFKEIAKDFSALPVQGDLFELGDVDIYQYPDFIRYKLLNLSEGEYTKPLKFDDSYIIFQRVKKM
jgi:hypothetical protein